MAANSIPKHANGSREFARKCREYGFAAVQCTHGALDCSNLPGIHISVCRTERLRLERAMTECAAAAKPLLPILAHRSNRRPWRITMDLDTFFHLYRGFIQTNRFDPAAPESEPCHDSDPVPVHLPAGSPAP